MLPGPSGRGRPTLLSGCGGLDAPTSGTVHCRDQDPGVYDDARPTHYRREHVGFGSRFPDPTPGVTARETVALVAETARDPMAPEEALRLVGLGDRRDHRPARLADGEPPRVAIARAIARGPGVPRCDAPTGALATATAVATHSAASVVCDSACITLTGRVLAIAGPGVPGFTGGELAFVLPGERGC